jgi:hypothetical protein
LNEYQTHGSDSRQSGLEGGQYNHQGVNNPLNHRYSHEDGKDTFLGSFLQSREVSLSGAQDQISTWQLQQQQMHQHQLHQNQHIDNHQVGPNYNSSGGMSSFSFNRNDELGASDLWAASQEGSGFGGVAMGNAGFGQQNAHLAHGAGVQLQSPWGSSSSSFLNQQTSSNSNNSGNHLSNFGDALSNSHGGSSSRMGDGNGGFQMGGGGNASSSSWGSFGNFNSDDNNIQATQGSGTFLRLESFAPQESASTGPPAGGIWDSNVLPYLSGGQTEALTAAAMYFQQQQMQQQQQQQQQMQQPHK